MSLNLSITHSEIKSSHHLIKSINQYKYNLHTHTSNTFILNNKNKYFYFLKMDSNMHWICRDIDPEEIERLMTHKKHSARKNIIKKYLLRNYFTKCKNIKDKKEMVVIKNTFNFFKLIFPMGLLCSYLSYKALFTGIYEIRSFYLNTASIPFFIRFLISAGMGYYVFDYFWMDYTYNEDIYQYAVNDLKRRKDKDLINI
jgi:hypothetical protein